MSRRSIGIALLVLAAVCAAHSAALAVNYAKLGPMMEGLTKYRPRHDWGPALKLARENSCPEVLVNLIDSCSRGDAAYMDLNDIALNGVGAYLRGQAIYSGVLAAILSVFGILALRREPGGGAT